jgi:signal transduction histidine kinase
VDLALDVVRWVTALLFAAVAVDGVRMWRRQRAPAAAWIIAAFGLLAGAIMVAQLLPDDPRTGVVAGLRVIFVLSLVAFPYLLYRFSDALRGEPDRWRGLLTVLAVVVLGVTVLAAPLLPAAEGTVWRGPFVALVLGYWTLFAVLVAVRLWRGGAGEPTPARRRMRTLATASIVLNAALLMAGTGTGEEGASTLALATNLTAGASAVLFAVGLSPPAPVRALWRRPEGRRLREAERGLMAATNAAEVAAGLLPPLMRLLGGRAATLYAADGRLLGHEFEVLPVPEAAPPTLPHAEFAGDHLVLHFEHGTAVVRTSRYTPFFGADEVALAEGLTTLIDLALGRVELADRERRTMSELERTNAELQTLLYGLSHDLRNPLLTMLGYVDLFNQGHGGSLDADGEMFMDRISRSARYMDSLIRDLLELSRVGRVHTEAGLVELNGLVRDVADEVRVGEDPLDIRVDSLGSVWMSPVRARQLFTNLLQNTVRHGGRDDLVVSVRGRREPDGSMTVSVTDNGVGVPPEYHGRVFGMFERLESGSGDGTGIGLAICKRIMENLGGSIEFVDAEQGAHIRLSFPAGVLRDQAVTESNA